MKCHDRACLVKEKGPVLKAVSADSQKVYGSQERSPDASIDIARPHGDEATGIVARQS